MKRTLLLWLGVLAFACIPVSAQGIGKIHGHVINPAGSPQAGGTVSLSKQGQDKVTLNVDQNGEFSGDAPAGTYTIVYRDVNTPKNQQVDSIEDVTIQAGQTTEQDVDMSRPEFIKKLPEAQQKQLEEIKKHNASALKENAIIKQLNADLRTVGEEIKAADTASVTAAQQLGSSANRQALEQKTEEIKTAKYTDIENMMTKDTGLKPDAAILWGRLGQAQMGLKKYDDAATSFKKALDLESAAKKPDADVQGLAESGLGEAYARQNKVPEANEAFDAAAKLNPAGAGIYYKNESVIFFQAGNADAQVAAADKAIAVDPKMAIAYYLKGQGLVQKATVDPKTNRIVLPPGCEEAYQKYLELQPDGPYSADVKGILQQAGEKISSSYKAPKKK